MIGIAEIVYTPEVGIALEGNYRSCDYASRKDLAFLGLQGEIFCEFGIDTNRHNRQSTS
jgi:hypothetical protein